MVESSLRYVLVRYDELMVSDESSEHLQEWFPLVGAKPADAKKLTGGFEKHAGSSFIVRPVLPGQVGHIYITRLHTTGSQFNQCSALVAFCMQMLYPFS